jgi:hypothetical protein
MNLNEYHEKVGKHLDLIEAGAAMAARHARALERRPAYETLAEDELEQVELKLRNALENIEAARSAYLSKELCHAS